MRKSVTYTFLNELLFKNKFKTASDLEQHLRTHHPNKWKNNEYLREFVRDLHDFHNW